MSRSAQAAYHVLASEVAIVEDSEMDSPPAPGSLAFCFDVLVAGAKFAGLQFQNSACSHIRIVQDNAGKWDEVLPSTPLLLHDYADALELEAWHFVPVSMVRMLASVCTRRGTRASRAHAADAAQVVLGPCEIYRLQRETQLTPAWRREPMCHFRVHVQYRAVEGVLAHQLRHVRCLKLAPADALPPSPRSHGDDAGTPNAGRDINPAGRRDCVADEAMLLSEFLAQRAKA